MIFLQTSIVVMQVALAMMLAPFLYMQWKVRDKGTPVVRRLRRHITWETLALLTAFITAAFVSRDGYARSLAGEVMAFIVTIFLFVTFFSGTRLYVDISRGKYDNELD